MQGELMDFSLRGLDLESLGAAYLLFLGSIAFTISIFSLSRMLLVITPNRPAKHYGLYVVMVLVGLGIAATLENEMVPAYALTLPFSVFPQLLLVLMVHLWIYYDQQPWLIGLGASSLTASMLVFGLGTSVTGQMNLAHYLTLALLSGLLAYLWHCSISTKRTFIRSQSIHIDSKETLTVRALPQRPWLGLPQWVALIGASLVLAMLNALLRGRGLAEVPAMPIVGQSLMMLVVTGFVCAIPATTYWLAHRHWMPELTRFVWLVWIVVGFAFTYGNFLTSLDRA